MNGWIKIDRRIMEMTGYFGEKFNRTMCWIDLLLLAEWENERSFSIRGSRVVVKRGQVAMSLKDLGERWKYTRMSVLRRLREFEESGMISITHSKVANIITIVNYNKYQGSMGMQAEQQLKYQTEQVKSCGKNRVTPNDTPNDTLSVTPNDTPQTAVISSIQSDYSEIECNRVTSDVTPNVTMDVTKSRLPIKNIKNNIKENLLTKVQESQTASAVLSSPPVGAEALRQEIPYQKIKNLWNEKCLAYPRIITLSDARKHKIQNRIAEMGGTEKAMPILEQLFANMQTSNFLKGDNRRGWKATFDWLFQNDKNWVKVYEGNYDNWTGSTSAESNNKASGNYTVTPDAFTEELAKYINSIPIG